MCSPPIVIPTHRRASHHRMRSALRVVSLVPLRMPGRRLNGPEEFEPTCRCDQSAFSFSSPHCRSSLPSRVPLTHHFSPSYAKRQSHAIARKSNTISEFAAFPASTQRSPISAKTGSRRDEPYTGGTRDPRMGMQRQTKVRVLWLYVSTSLTFGCKSS